MTATMTPAPRLAVTAPDFSITSAEVKAAREESWYAHTEYGLAILRYEEVSSLVRHPNLRQGSVAWPAHNGITSGLWATWFDSWILNKEGEEHHRLRRLLNPAFSRKLIAALVPRFQALGEELIDSFASRGECEFMTEFAEPYAARVIAIMLGLPEEEWPMIAKEAATIGLGMGVNVRKDLPLVEAALERLYAYADNLVADRSAQPRDDFMTALVQASRDGDRLNATELRDAIVLLIFGGYDTTRNQLGLAIQTFMQHPDQWRLLGERPELGGKAVEEVMRVNPTVRWVTREARETFEFRGLTIEGGTTIHLFSEAAGTDPRVFGEPSFDIEADRKPHYGFGGGAHHCLGHFVARSDMSEALPLLAQRLHDPAALPGSRWYPDSGNTGPVTLPISFTPAP